MTTHYLEDLTTRTLLEYWELSKLPFPKLSQPNDAFMNPNFKYALARLEQVLDTKEVGVVVGEAGTGKTTLLRYFTDRISANRYRLIHLPAPHSKPRELYRAISSALGINISLMGADALKVTDLLTYAFAESSRSNIMIVDEAHCMSPTCLNELRLLTNSVVKNEPLLTVVLFGQPSLGSTLKLPSMIPLAQRINSWVTLNALTEEEGNGYIDHQMLIAGQKEEIFSPGSKKAITRRAQGNPRLINRLCWESLNQGCLDGAKTVTEQVVEYVAKKQLPHLLP